MVGKFLLTGKRLFSHKQSNILSAAMVLMFTVLLSRILGLVRDRLLAGAFFGGGDHWQLDVYFAAFRLPDMLFQLIVLGALSAAFIPVYSHYLKKDAQEASEIARSVMTLACISFALLALGIYCFAYPLSGLIAPKFDVLEMGLMVDITRWLLVAQFFFVISNFLTGILQSHQRFLIPALAPVVYNVGIIGGIWGLSPHIGIYGPVIGVVIGALLHLLVQLPLVRQLGFSYRPRLGLDLAGVRKIGKLMMPRTLALAVNQVELTIAVFLASAMSAGSLSIFYFAQHLHTLPVGLFGLTIGQAALPLLSQEADSWLHNMTRFKELFISSFNYIVYLALPASVLLLVLRIPLVRIAFGAKEFPWDATLLTGEVVAVFAFSVVAQAVIQLLVRTFYALQNTQIPLIIGTIAVAINVWLSLWFTRGLGMGIVGLGLAITISTILQAVCLLIFLARQLPGLELSKIAIPFIKMLIASGLTGIALWIPMRLLDEFVLDTTRTIQLIMLTVVASGSGFMVYIIFSKILQIQELDRLLETLQRFGAWRKILVESEEILAEPTSGSGKE